MTVKFQLNGEPAVAEINAADSLLDMLRSLHVYSVRSGCDTSNCGICTVWVDGVPQLSCSYPAARAQGKCVTTVEGIKEEAQDFLTALAEEGADQCGFCSPGFIMSAMALLRDYQDPTDEEIKAYLAGNLCRCTGYVSQTRAIRRVLDARNGK